jgi:hypothetical protein
MAEDIAIRNARLTVDASIDMEKIRALHQFASYDSESATIQALPRNLGAFSENAGTACNRINLRSSPWYPLPEEPITYT